MVSIFNHKCLLAPYISSGKTYPLPEGKIRIYDYANVGSAYLSNNNLKDDKIGFSYYQKAWSFSQSLSLELRKSQYLRSLFSNYYYKQTFSYLKKDDVQRGLDAVKKAISADYSSASNHDLYAEILYNNKNYREAFSQALKAIALNLDSVNSHLLLGEIYSKHLGRPFWAIYHWQKAQSLTDGSKNEKLTIKIKHIQNQLRKMGFSKQSSTTQNLDETKILLRTKTPPPSDFLLDLTFPSDLFNRSIDEIDQYLIKLYQYLNLAEEKKKAHIYYQIGMLYWKLKGRQNAAYHYFNIAWNLGLHFPRFENLLDQLYANQTKQPIP